MGHPVFNIAWLHWELTHPEVGSEWTTDELIDIPDNLRVTIDELCEELKSAFSNVENLRRGRRLGTSLYQTIKCIIEREEFEDLIDSFLI